MIIYGRHPIEEALDAGKTLDKVFFQKDLKGDFFNSIKKELLHRNVPFQNVPVEKLDRLVKGTHQGIAAIISLVTYYKVEDVLAQVFEKGETPLFLVLDEISDVRNLGAIARTALNTGVHAIVIPEKGSARITSEAMKASAGALNKIYICREPDMMRTLKYFQLSGCSIFACQTKAEKYIYDVDLTVPAVFIMGSEGKGITPTFMRMADELVKIPMTGGIESYNVSVAAGMILYEVMRQKVKG